MYRRIALTLIGAAVWGSSGCAAITDIRLSKYRDAPRLEQYHYALGERYIEVDGLKLCYQEEGRGDDVLILPGLGTSIDFWQLNIPELAKCYHVVAMDLPGFGKSDKPDVPYEIPWLADRVLSFMDAMHIQHASIIGGSLGGHVALWIAIHHPERADHLVLMGAVGAWAAPGPLLAGGLKLFWPEGLVINHLRSRWPTIYDKFTIQQTPLTDSLFRYQMARRADLSLYRTEGRASSRALLNIFFASCRDRMHEVQCPVLLIWGREDRIHAPASGLEFRKRLPDSRLVVVPGAGHEVMIDQPADFNRLVLAFLEYGTAVIRDVGADAVKIHSG